MTERNDPTTRTEMTVHERDTAELAAGLAPWLAEKLGVDSVQIDDLTMPEAGGMSSATVLFTATWEGGTRRLVLRLPPEESSFPVFQTYDFAEQARVMDSVGEHTDVPVPAVLGVETTGDVLGGPFLVMDRIDGEVPSDNPPYVFGGWLLDATDEQRDRMTRSSVAVLAAIHQKVPVDHEPGALRRHVDEQRAYYDWTREGTDIVIPVIDDTFAWLEEHWPTGSLDTCLSWGDARIGNMAFTDFVPTGVLDWEMATVGPPELDIAWMVFLHRFFQDIAEVFELPGIPSFMHRDTVASTYEELTGHAPADFDWFLVYAALRHAVVMSRVKQRMIHFGQDQVPENPDDYVMHQVALRQLLAGTYDWGTAS